MNRKSNVCAHYSHRTAGTAEGLQEDATARQRILVVDVPSIAFDDRLRFLLKSEELLRHTIYEEKRQRILTKGYFYVHTLPMGTVLTQESATFVGSHQKSKGK